MKGASPFGICWNSVEKMKALKSPTSPQDQGQSASHRERHSACRWSMNSRLSSQPWKSPNLLDSPYADYALSSADPPPTTYLGFQSDLADSSAPQQTSSTPQA